MGDPSIWSEFGLPGMVIGALFVSIVLMFRKGLDLFRHSQNTHREDRKEWRQEHQSERKDWLQESAKREERGMVAIEKLATAVENLRK